MFRNMLVAILFSASLVHGQTLKSVPSIGQKAPAFSLSTPAGQIVELGSLTQKGPVVLVVLRGYPGYQCP